jgi:large subunit ribosomal protein L13e
LDPIIVISEPRQWFFVDLQSKRGENAGNWDGWGLKEPDEPDWLANFLLIRGKNWTLTNTEYCCRTDMGFAHNNVLHANHFRKDWQRRVRTWFNQPGRKLRRRNSRIAKVAAIGARPISLLRPAVRAPTVKYNNKIREGRGFTLAELKEAGIGRKHAKGLGIVVDHRRRNRSEEGQKLNVERLKEYKGRLIVFPRKASKPKKGDSQGDALKALTTKQSLPLPPAFTPEAPRAITAEEREFNAYRTLRVARSDKRHEGMRKIRKAKKEEEEANKKK